MQRLRLLLLLVATLSSACEGTIELSKNYREPSSTDNATPEDASVGGNGGSGNGGTASTANGGAMDGSISMDGAVGMDASAPPPCVPFTMPAECLDQNGSVIHPADGELPTDLRCTGLYGDYEKRAIACGVRPFKPAYELWTDGAVKRRFAYIPPGKTIDTTNPDAFVYPVGTQFWKEFNIQDGQGGTRIGETRLLRKTDTGWVYTSYVWNPEGAEAVQDNNGSLNLFGLNHDVPTRDECTTCHKGRGDSFILGWDPLMLGPGATGVTIQSLIAEGLVTSVGALPQARVAPGNAIEARALGILHANCGVSCHNRNTSPRPDGAGPGLFLRLDANQTTVAATDAYKAINKKPWPNITGFETLPTLTGPWYDIRPLDVSRSLLVARMDTRGRAKMPRLGTNVIDHAAVDAVIAWINQMTEANGYPAPIADGGTGGTNTTGGGGTTTTGGGGTTTSGGGGTTTSGGGGTTTTGGGGTTTTGGGGTTTTGGGGTTTTGGGGTTTSGGGGTTTTGGGGTTTTGGGGTTTTGGGGTTTTGGGGTTTTGGGGTTTTGGGGTTTTGGGGTTTTGGGGTTTGGGSNTGGSTGGDACSAANAPAPGKLYLQAVVTGITGLLYAAQAPGSTDWYLVTQTGYIYVLRNGAILTQPFLDIHAHVGSIDLSYDERGLFSVAFPPDYAGNGKFYVMLTRTTNARGDTTDYIYEYSRKSGTATPEADANSQRIIVALPESASNHNGGTLKFGPDGYLYASTGDGGGGCNSNKPGSAQDVSQLFGKILRLDPRASCSAGDVECFGASGNPFAASKAVLHYGLRNPFRFSFDRATGDLYIGDVGQKVMEEISFAPAGSKGLNFGWPRFEGSGLSTASPSNCDPTNLSGATHTPPIFSANRTDGGIFAEYQSIMGGMVYRGSAITRLKGVYLFGDWGAQYLGSLYQCGTTTSAVTPINKQCGGGVTNNCFEAKPGTPALTGIFAFAEGSDGEMYIVGNGSTLFKVLGN